MTQWKFDDDLDGTFAEDATAAEREAGIDARRAQR